MNRRLEVLIHDSLVGHISEMPTGNVEFCFLPAYREATPRPVLGQRFESDLERIYRNRKGQRLPDFFTNLFAEGRLRDIIEEITDLEAGDDLALLSFVGRDLPGAVVVRPVGEEAAISFSKEAAKSRPIEDEAGTSAGGLRFSLAGVQLKFSMLLRDKKLTLPAKDESGDLIVKFDTPTFPQLPENEFSMLTWARAAGFDVPECRLHDADDVVGLPRRYIPEGSRLLAIRRYDRSPEGRIHQEDFAQAVGLPPGKKYEQITYEVMARLVRRFIDEEAVDELVRRLVFIIACGNSDAHLKNWSLVYPDGIRARWSPLYDQVATIAWKDPARALALKLAGVKDFARIDRSTFERFAQKADLDARRVFGEVHATLERLRSVWQDVEASPPLPRSHRESLCEHWRTVPLLRAAGALDSVR